MRNWIQPMCLLLLSAAITQAEVSREVDHFCMADFTPLDKLRGVARGREFRPDLRRVGASAAAMRLALWSEKKWPDATNIHVRFLNRESIAPRTITLIEKYAQQWEPYTTVKFIFDDHPNSQIRIDVSPDGKSWSNYGTDAILVDRQSPSMHYGWFRANTPEIEFCRTVLHEFGHALGAIHEHQHPDGGIQWNKPFIYARFASQVPPWSRREVDQNLFDAFARSEVLAGAFDPASIMLYPIPAGWTTNGFVVGLNQVLSDGDKRTMANLYNKTLPIDPVVTPPIVVTPPPVDTGGTTADLRGSVAPGAAIPDGSFSGIKSELRIPGSTTVTKIRVDVDVQHPRPGDLQLSLVSPLGKVAVLQRIAFGASAEWVGNFHSDRSSALQALVGEPSAGPWTLRVIDARRGSEGTLSRWTLKLFGR